MSKIERRPLTFPGDVVQRVADELCDLNSHLPGDEAMDVARDMVIDVTLAVDKLRASEAFRPYRGDSVEAWMRRLRDRHHPATTEWITINEELLDRYRELADYGLSLAAEDDEKGDP